MRFGWRESMGGVAAVVLLVTATGASAGGAQQGAQANGGRATVVGVDLSTLGLDDFSPAFLGIYRKVMEIEDQIRRQTERYGLDYDLARAVCLYESGGNANLTSWAGAKGYFQVMPATRRLLGVDDNIEAGVKYLSQLVERFEREDYALAAYNGGPAAVGRSRPMRLESLQYVLGVGHYRMILKLYEEPVRRFASQLQLYTVREGDDWWKISQHLGIRLVQLRLFNPYLGVREPKPGQLVAYPATPRDDLFYIEDDSLYYRSRLGDNYFGVGFAFEVELDAIRDANDLWHLQTLPPGMELRLPLVWEDPNPDEDEEEEEEIEPQIHRVTEGQTITQLAEIYQSSPWRVIRDNNLWDEQLRVGRMLEIRPLPQEPLYVQHTVRRGDTLIGIAIRYGTSVRAIQDANEMGTRTLIRVGRGLRIPAPRRSS